MPIVQQVFKMKRALFIKYYAHKTNVQILFKIAVRHFRVNLSFIYTTQNMEVEIQLETGGAERRMFID